MGLLLLIEYMNIHVGIDTKDLSRKLDSMRSSLSGPQMKRAISIGINTTAMQVRTVSAREIREVYNIRYGYLSGKFIKIQRASAGKLFAGIDMSTRPISMSEFLKSKGNKQGVSIQIKKGKTEQIKGAFLFKSKFSDTGRLSIMHRSFVAGNSSYRDSFMFRHKRISAGKDLPIGNLFSVSPFSSVFNRVVQANILDIGSRKLQENIYSTLDKMALGLIRDARR